MKSKNIAALLLLIICLFNSFLDAQDVVTAQVTPHCGNEYTGSITLIIDEGQLEPEYVLPFEVEYINVTIGYVGTLVMETYTQTFSPMPAGMYKLDIDLNEECRFSLQVEIESISEIIVDGVFTVTQPSECSADDGDLRVHQVDILGGEEPYEYAWEDQDGNEPNTTNYGITDLSFGKY